MNPLDVLELELRQLPGVLAVGLHEEDDGLVVRLAVRPESDDSEVRRRATMLAKTHAEHVTVLTIDGGDEPAEVRTRARVRLLAVVRVPSTDELEVHLAFGGRRTIGRRKGMGPLTGAVEATLQALVALGADLPFRPLWSEEVRPEVPDEERPLTIAVGLDASEVGESRSRRYGIAAGVSPEEAAARATLHALNRHLGTALRAA